MILFFDEWWLHTTKNYYYLCRIVAPPGSAQAPTSSQHTPPTHTPHEHSHDSEQDSIWGVAKPAIVTTSGEIVLLVSSCQRNKQSCSRVIHKLHFGTFSCEITIRGYYCNTLMVVMILRQSVSKVCVFWAILRDGCRITYLYSCNSNTTVAKKLQQ